MIDGWGQVSESKAEVKKENLGSMWALSRANGHLSLIQVVWVRVL